MASPVKDLPLKLNAFVINRLKQFACYRYRLKRCVKCVITLNVECYFIFRIIRKLINTLKNH